MGEKLSPQGKLSSLKEVGKAAAEVGAAGVATGIVDVAVIAVHQHRNVTHRSVKLHPLLEKGIERMQRMIGYDGAKGWGGVHRTHHSWTDASGKGYYDLYHAIREAEERGLPVPDSFSHLDRKVRRFSRVQVEQIGGLADAEVQKRLGNAYQVPTFGNDDEVIAALHPTEPTYPYPKVRRDPDGYTQDQIIYGILTDPHSPALAPPKNGRQNGVRTVAVKTPVYYHETERLLREHPELRDPDLRDETPHKSVKKDMLLGMALSSAAVFVARRRYTLKDAAIAAVAGSAFHGIRTGTSILGGGIVNSLGHAGRLTGTELGRALFDRQYEPKVNPEDGSLTTDANYAGVAGKVLSAVTFDEVGRQRFHHLHPEDIAYTDRPGWRGWVDAPFGKVVEKMANSRLFPFIQPGDGFGDIPREERPDMPHRAVRLIQAARLEQLREDKENGVNEPESQPRRRVRSLTDKIFRKE